MTGKIISIGTASPKYEFKQSEILSFMESAYTDDKDIRRLKALFYMSGIEKRYSVLPDFGMIRDPEFFKLRKEQPHVEDRMTVFRNNALSLASDAINDALKSTETSVTEITHLITVTCTGLHAPGLNAELIKHLNLREDVFHTSVNFLGCNAAFYALKIADLILRDDPNANVMMVCVELCTLHFQPKGTTDNLLSNTIFGDGAAAVLLQSEEKETPGFCIKGFYSLLLHKGNDLMGWNVNPQSFEMILSAQIPTFIGEEVNSIVEKASNFYHVDSNEIAVWGIHPGGKKILDEIGKQMHLEKDKMQYSYEVLRNFGNMSSPTILFVLKMIMESGLDVGDKVLAIGFGPGLSIETSLLSYE